MRVKQVCRVEAAIYILAGWLDQHAGNTRGQDFSSSTEAQDAEGAFLLTKGVEGVQVLSPGSPASSSAPGCLFHLPPSLVFPGTHRSSQTALPSMAISLSCSLCCSNLSDCPSYFYLLVLQDPVEV